MSQSLFLPPRVREAVQKCEHYLANVSHRPIPIHIWGESGVGKSSLALEIHQRFSASRPIVSFECTSVPDGLFCATLVGYSRGAFTGAERDEPGILMKANGGTLVLEDISFLSHDTQKQLIGILNDLSRNKCTPLGSTAARDVSVQLISTSRVDLRAASRSGAFIDDLFYRLCGAELRLPSLRELSEDQRVQAIRFVADSVARELGRTEAAISSDAFRALCSAEWRGNYRELQATLRRSMVVSDGDLSGRVAAEEPELPVDLGSGVLDSPGSRIELCPPVTVTSIPADKKLKDLRDEIVTEVERRVIHAILADSKWKKSRAADRLGISRPTLDAKIDRYGLKREGE